MSKILQGISRTNLNEGVGGALIGGGLGSQVPKAYNAVADVTGLPKVDPNADPLGAELDTITTATGAVMGHNTQKNRAAKKEAEKVQQALAQAAQQQTAAAPAASSSTTPPKVGSTGQAAKSIAKDIPNIIKSAPSKKIALYTVGAYLVNKGVDALTGQSILDRVENMWNKRNDGTGAAAPTSSTGTAAPTSSTGTATPAASSGTPEPIIAPSVVSRPDARKGNQTNPNVKCEIDPVTGTLPPGCLTGVPVYENKSISEGIAVAEANKLKTAKELVGKGYDWLHDLYLKRIGQTTKKDVEDWYQQHGGGTASPILKPGSDFKKGEPITYTDVKKWDDQFKQLSKEQQQELVDKLTKTKEGQRTLAGLTAAGVVGGVGGAMYSGIEKAHDQAISDKPKPEVKPAKPERKREEPVAVEPEPTTVVEPTVEPPAAEPTPAPIAEPAQDSNQCVVGGDVLDLSPEECARMKELTSENISENVNNLISQIAIDNKLKDPNLIQIGQRLKLPGNLVYTVRSGDNLTKIAQALLARAGSQQEPMRTFTISSPKISQKYPDSGLKPGEQFVDPRNNPGNLRFYKNLNQPGYVLDKAIGVDKNGFAVFATPEDGLDAMRRQIAIDARKGLTGRQFIAKYAPAADRNDPEVYTKNVFGELGLDPDQPLNPELIPLIQPLMIRQEHGKEGMYYYMPQTDPRNKVANLTEMEILQRFLDKQIEKGAKAQAEKDKQKAASEKPVPNPNARYAKPGEPKSAPYDISEPPKTYSDAEIAAIALPKDIEDAKKLKKVPENKFDAVKKVIGAGRYVVFNPSTGLRLQTNDVNKAVNAAQLMAKKDLDRPTMVYDTQTKFPVAAYRGSEDMYLQRDIRHESKSYKKK